jgi:hypothetical protein
VIGCVEGVVSTKCDKQDEADSGLVCEKEVELQDPKG